MSDLRTLRRETRADQCVECGKCTSMCPLGTRADFSARRIAAEDLQFEIDGQGVGVGRCLTCASCEQRCPQDVQFIEFVRGLRAHVPIQNRRPCPHGAFLRHAATIQSADGTRFRALDWLGDDLEVAEEGEVGLFVGCAPLMDTVFAADLGVDMSAIPRAAVQILNSRGIVPVVLAEESCCGHDELWGGDRERFEELGRANLAAFKDHGVRHLITACAECSRTWSLDYPLLDPGYHPRVQHMSQWIAENVEDLPWAEGAERTERTTYHDPCRLGRHQGEYEAPRTVLEAIPDLELTEMPRHGRNALCCGTSGFQHCDAESRRLQTERLTSARQTGADRMVTACPKCMVHFSCAQHEDERRNGDHSPIELIDLTVLTASRLRETVTSAGVEPGPTQEPVHE